MYKYSDGTFKSEEIPSNAEAVKYVVSLMDLEPVARAAKGKYKNLDPQHWANGYFYVASEFGYFKNLDEKKFASDEYDITCQEFVTLVLNAMGYGKITTGANGYWMRAKDIDLFNGMKFSAIGRNEVVSRGFIANILYNALNAPILDSEDGITAPTSKTLYEIIYNY